MCCDGRYVRVHPPLHTICRVSPGPIGDASEAAVEGQPGPDGDGGGLLARQPFAVGRGQDLLAVDPARRLSDRAEEVLQHARVALDGAPGARVALLLGREGVEGLLPGGHVLEESDGSSQGRSPRVRIVRTMLR